MALRTRLDTSLDKVEAALELCRRTIATVKQGRISFIRDITEILEDCVQVYQYPGLARCRSLLIQFAGLCFASIYDKTGISGMADYSFYLYTITGDEPAPERRFKEAWNSQTMPDFLAGLEYSFGRLLGKGIIIILPVQKSGRILCLSKVSSELYRNAGGECFIDLQQERHGNMPEPQESPISALPQSSVLSQPIRTYDTSEDRTLRIDARPVTFRLLPGGPAPRDMLPDTVENPMTMAPDISQAVSSNEQLGRPSEYQMHVLHPGSKRATRKDYRRDPVAADIFEVSIDTSTIPIPPLRDIVNPDASNSTGYQGYNTSANGGNKGLDTGPLVIAPSTHPSSSTNAMIQFAAYIDKYGKQRAAQAEGGLNNFPAPQLSSTSIATHPNFPSEILRKVAMRKSPTIQIYGLDLSCAFVVQDLTQSDASIIYASDACAKLTGYTRDEIVDRNFLFTQFRHEQRNSGVQRLSFKSPAFSILQGYVSPRSEYQMRCISYKKRGQPFKNLVTGIPVCWDGGECRFYVRFMIDFGKHPACVLLERSDGTCVVDYSQTQTSNPVNESDDESEQDGIYVYRRSPTTTPVNEPAGTSLVNDPYTQISRAASDPGGTALVNHTLQRSINPTYDLGHPTDQQASMLQSNALAEQTALLSMTSPEADSPWSERDGMPPPYALSPGVFYHTSRTAMLSP